MKNADCNDRCAHLPAFDHINHHFASIFVVLVANVTAIPNAFVQLIHSTMSFGGVRTSAARAILMAVWSMRCNGRMHLN